MSKRTISTLLLVLATFGAGWLLGRQRPSPAQQSAEAMASAAGSNSIPADSVRHPTEREPGTNTVSRQTLREAMNAALRNVGSRRNRALRDFVLSLRPSEIPEALVILEKEAPASDRATRSLPWRSGGRHVSCLPFEPATSTSADLLAVRKAPPRESASDWPRPFALRPPNSRPRP